MAYGLARDVKCEIEGCGRMIAILYEWNGKTVCWRCYEELALALKRCRACGIASPIKDWGAPDPAAPEIEGFTIRCLNCKVVQ